MLILLASPGIAAQPSTLGCVGLAIGEERIRFLGENALARNDRRPAPPAHRALDEMAQAVDYCRQRHGWSDAAATAAGMWTLASARLDAVAEALRRDGVDPMRAGELVDRLEKQHRDGLLNEPIPPAALRALRDLAVQAGLPTEGEPAHHLVWFTIMLIMEDRERAAFALY